MKGTNSFRRWGTLHQNLSWPDPHVTLALLHDQESILPEASGDRVDHLRRLNRDGIRIHKGRQGPGSEKIMRKTERNAFNQGASSDKTGASLVPKDGQPRKSGILAEHPVDLYLQG